MARKSQPTGCRRRRLATTAPTVPPTTTATMKLTSPMLVHAGLVEG